MKRPLDMWPYVPAKGKQLAVSYDSTGKGDGINSVWKKVVAVY